MKEERQQEDAGTVSMYLLWHSELKPPVVRISREEVRIYVQLMRVLGKGTPRWCEIEDDYFEGIGI